MFLLPTWATWVATMLWILTNFNLYGVRWRYLLGNYAQAHAHYGMELGAGQLAAMVQVHT